MPSKKSKVKQSKVQRHPLAIAWDRWIANQIKILEDAPTGIYLEKRLREAFEEGWDAAKGGNS